MTAPGFSGIMTVPKIRCFQTRTFPSGSLKSMKWMDYVDCVSDRQEQQNNARQ